MKTLFPFLLLCICFLSCNNETPTAEEPSTDITTNPDGTQHFKASTLAPFIGLWNYTLGVSSDVDRKNDYVGRWIEFKKDMTFNSGRWEDQTNSGTWAYDEDQTILSLDYKDDAKDTDIDWSIKLGGDVMIWLGNANNNNNGDQIRMQMVPERPTKPAGQ